MLGDSRIKHWYLSGQEMSSPFGGYENQLLDKLGLKMGIDSLKRFSQSLMFS